jgi:hypothetical protein
MCLKTEALKRVHGWHYPLLDLLESTDPDNISGHPVYDRDPVPEAHPLGNQLITLLGDACHRTCIRA